MADTGVHNLASMGEYRKAVEEGGAMVIDCFATWCGPCKVVAPKIVEFSKKYESVRFYKLDVDAVPDVAQELAITAMPTFKFFSNGELVNTVMGANPPAIEAAVQKLTG